MDIVVLGVQVAATLLVVYGGVLCLQHQLWRSAPSRDLLAREGGARHSRLVAELEHLVS